MMSESKRPFIAIKADLFWFSALVILLFFCGEPDLMDAIIYRLMECS